MRKQMMVWSLVFILLFAGAAWGDPMADIGKAVEQNRADQIKTTQELVKIEAYNQISADYSGPYPAEGVVDSLKYVMEKAEAMGFKAVLHRWEGTQGARGPLYGYAEYGPEDAPEMIMALGHLDTVPPGNASLWVKGGPYEAKIVKIDGDDHIIGRGVYDDKGPALAALYSLKALKDANVPLARRVRIFFGTTEDYGGWRCVSAYATDATAGREEWPVLGFSPDSGSFQPTYIEKSSVSVTAQNKIDNSQNAVKLTFLNGGTAGNAVSDRCQATLEGSEADLTAIKTAMEAAIAEKKWDLSALPITFELSGGKLKIDITGRAAHSGWAWEGVGANNRMAFLLSKAPVIADWKTIAEKITGLLPPDETEANMGAALGIQEGGLVYSDIVTVNMGLFRLDNTAASGDLIYNGINIRYPDTGADVLTGTKHQSGQEIRTKVDEKFKAAGLSASVTGGSYPYTVPMDSEIIVKLQKAYKEITGDAVTPCITNGGTYAAAWRNSKLGPDTDETFGYRMVSWGIDGGIGMHEADEAMSVPKLIEGTKVMAMAMAYLASDAVIVANGRVTDETEMSDAAGSVVILSLDDEIKEAAELPNGKLETVPVEASETTVKLNASATGATFRITAYNPVKGSRLVPLIRAKATDVWTVMEPYTETNGDYQSVLEFTVADNGPYDYDPAGGTVKVQYVIARVTPATAPESKGSGGGGCDAGVGFGILGLAVCALAAFKYRS